MNEIPNKVPQELPQEVQPVENKTTPVREVAGKEILEEKNLHLAPLGERFLNRIYPDGTKLSPEERELNPVVVIKPSAETAKIMDSFKGQFGGKIASVASSGNMPDWWVPADLKDKSIDEVLQFLKENEKFQNRVGRFIDTKDQFDKARNSIRDKVAGVVQNLEAQGAKEITFSVCSAAAGFDMMLVSVLKELIEEGKKNIKVVITLPFDKESVRGYSISVGLQQDFYKEMYQWLLDNDAEGKVGGSVFFLNPSVIPYFQEDADFGAPNVDEIHARSTLINGNANQVYIDVNNEIFRRAQELAGADGMSVLLFDQGKLGMDLLGGAMHMAAMAQATGVPMDPNRIMVVQEGILTPVPYTLEMYNALPEKYGKVLSNINMKDAELKALMKELGVGV